MSRLRIVDPAEVEAHRARVARLFPHPVLDWFPLLDHAGLAQLSFDLERYGLRDPVVVHGDVVLDGRARLRACELAQVEPELTEWFGDLQEIPAWIVSRNLHRRHLTTSQRAMIAGRLVTTTHGGQRANLHVEVSAGRAAALLNVSERTTKDARAVLESGDPDLIAQVDAGDLAVSTAAEQLRAPSRAERLERTRAELADLRPDPVELREVLADQQPKHVRAAVRTARRVNDAYYTPAEVVAAAMVAATELELTRWVPTGGWERPRVLEPHVGGGAWAQFVQASKPGSLTVLDIDPEAAGLALGDERIVDDFLLHDFGDEQFDIIVGNPPFSEAEAHVRRALSLLAPGGRLGFLLRRNWPAHPRFGLLLEEQRCPVAEFVLGPRVSFTGDGGTDQQEYSFFVWTPEPSTSWRTAPLLVA